MVKKNASGAWWEDVLGITLVPAVARLPPAVFAERRNVAVRRALLRRILAEFEEVRGLSMTLGQAAKLFGLSLDIASRILQRLIEARVLCQTSDGQFTLRGERS